MFTGLIEEVGTISAVNRHGTIADFTIEARRIAGDIAVGDSLAVNGACLTVTAKDSSTVIAQAVHETLDRTTLGSFRHGTRVNLERALTLGGRLGGHIVQGHVDGTGKLVSRTGADNVLFGIHHDPGFSRYIVEKGSIAVDGVSLTVTHAKQGEFGISVIPHTLAASTLGGLMVGDMVNLETDIIAKYLEKLAAGDTATLTLERMKTLGY